jgi:hypothetical protein
MATVGGSTVITLSDFAKTLDPDGKIARIIEILNETNEVLDDWMFKEGNLPTGHQHTVRGGIPAPTWRLLNYGVPVTKAQSAQVVDTCGMLEDFGEVDEDLAMLNGNTEAFRLSEDSAHIEGMSQEAANTLFYGNQASDPEEFTGLAPRFNSLSAENADNILTGDGTGGDNTSIWLIGWGEKSCFGIYPKGSQMGLKAEDLGRDRLTDADGNYYMGLVAHYQWKMGLAVPDWRYIVRICNIDISNLKKDAATGSDLVDLMTQALELPPSLTNVRPVFYCNRTIRSFLRRQIKNSNNVQINMEEVAGKKVTTFDGIPVRRCDALTNAEALVS